MLLRDYLKQAFKLENGQKIYKIALSSGCTCPNRDGKLDTRGCIFCSAGGSGEFAQHPEQSVAEQIEYAKALIAAKSPRGGYAGYIAYFQSFTNTYASADVLRPIFYEAVNNPEVAVLSVATRPDCLEPDVLDLLEELSHVKPVWVELGLQTVHPDTAEYIRRGYRLEVFDSAVLDLKSRGLSVIVHLILGLPGETSSDMIESCDYVSHVLTRAASEAPFSDIPYADGIKLQLLHVLRGTDLADDYAAGRFRVLSMEEYFDVLDECLAVIDDSLVIHRITGDGAKKDLIAPLWSANKKAVLNAWNNRTNNQE